MNIPLEVDGEDAELLHRAAGHREMMTLAECTPDALCDAARKHGVDFAAAVLFDRILANPRHAALIARVNTSINLTKERVETRETSLVIVPGAYYREYPQFGGDGRLLREIAGEIGLFSEMIPLPSTATLHDNAAKILAYLQSLKGKRVVLASLSKGSADVKTALQLPGAAHAFSHVTHWIDLSGILDGTPLATRVTRSLPLSMLARAWFWWRGYEWRMVDDLAEKNSGPLCKPVQLPAHLRVIHVIGLPMTRHVTTPMAQRHHRRLSALGPNDGCMMLAQCVRWPGELYPIWGADHYLRPPERMKPLARAILHDVLASRST